MENRYLAITILCGSAFVAGCGDDSSTNRGYSGTISDLNPGQSLSLKTGNGTLSFDTSNAKITNDGESDLSNGKVVTIQGSHDGNSGDAESIEYDSEVEGFVISNSIVADNNGSMNVMGQKIVVDETTMYDDGLTHASEIIADPVNLVSVEVSGYFQIDGTILAKYIEYKSDSTEIEIKGFITGLLITGDTATFAIAGCDIIVNAATELDHIRSVVDLIEGAKVEVKSHKDLFDGSNGTCTVTAQEVELEDEDEDDDDENDDDNS